MSAPRWLPGAGGEPDRPRLPEGLQALTAAGAEGEDDPLRDTPELPLPWAITACADTLRRAGDELARLPLEARIAGIARTARSLLDPDDPFRQALLAALPDELDATPAVVAHGLDAALDVVDEMSLRAWWASQGGPRSARLSGHLLAGNVVVAGLPPILGSLLAGVPALIKAPTGQGSFATILARALSWHAPELGPTVGAACFSRDDRRSTLAMLGACDVVIAFGDDASTAAVAALAPPSCRVHALGHRVSMALLPELDRDGAFGPPGPEDPVPDSLLVALARDALAHDGLGCLTPRWVFVVGDLDRAATLAHRAAALLPAVAAALPGRPLSDAAAGARAQALGVAGFVGFAVAGPGWCVTAQPALLPGPPPRGLCFVPVASLESMVALLAPLGDHLQALALPGAALPPGLEPLLAQGLSRVCLPGALQTPPLSWNHDGLAILGAFTEHGPEGIIAP